MCQARNAALAAWAAAAGPRAEYINFGMLARAHGGPAAGAGGGWHYQCFLQVLPEHKTAPAPRSHSSLVLGCCTAHGCKGSRCLRNC